MTESEAREFVTKFAAAWAARDGNAFLALWHPDGKLHSPFYDRVVAGRELGALNDLQRIQQPQLAWTLLGWTWRGDVVVIEWEVSNRFGEQTVRWRGVDKLTLRGGRIAEEVVYVDTAPLHALRGGRPVEALAPLPESLA
jgi:ketosteroid isomerase-like protein